MTSESPEPSSETAEEPVRASLFVTCIIDQLYPEVGESTVRVLDRLGVELDWDEVERQTDSVM